MLLFAGCSGRRYDSLLLPRRCLWRLYEYALRIDIEWDVSPLNTAKDSSKNTEEAESEECRGTLRFTIHLREYRAAKRGSYKRLSESWIACQLASPDPPERYFMVRDEEHHQPADRGARRFSSKTAGCALAPPAFSLWDALSWARVGQEEPDQSYMGPSRAHPLQRVIISYSRWSSESAASQGLLDEVWGSLPTGSIPHAMVGGQPRRSQWPPTQTGLRSNRR